MRTKPSVNHPVAQVSSSESFLKPHNLYHLEFSLFKKSKQDLKQHGFSSAGKKATNTPRP